MECDKCAAAVLFLAVLACSAHYPQPISVEGAKISDPSTQKAIFWIAHLERGNLPDQKSVQV